MRVARRINSNVSEVPMYACLKANTRVGFR